MARLTRYGAPPPQYAARARRSISLRIRLPPDWKNALNTCVNSILSTWFPKFARRFAVTPRASSPAPRRLACFVVSSCGEHPRFWLSLPRHDVGGCASITLHVGEGTPDQPGREAVW